MVLVVGATGLVGNEICRLLCKEGREVAGLIRSTSDTDKIELLKHYGVNIIEGDLKDYQSIENACRGVTSIISTASSTISHQEGDTIQSVDLEGQINLVKAAKKNSVEKFVFISFRNNPDIQYPLTVAKRQVEKEIINSGIDYTIVQASWFMEVWLSEALGFDIENCKVNIYGEGHHKTSWVSYKDIAKFAEISLIHPEAKNHIVEIGGPEGLSPLEVVAIFEKKLNKQFAINFIPETDLKTQKDNAPDPLSESFAGLMLQYAAGDNIEMKKTLRTYPMHMITVEQFAEEKVKELNEKKNKMIL